MSPPKPSSSWIRIVHGEWSEDCPSERIVRVRRLTFNELEVLFCSDPSRVIYNPTETSTGSPDKWTGSCREDCAFPNNMPDIGSWLSYSIPHSVRQQRSSQVSLLNRFNTYAHYTFGVWFIFISLFYRWTHKWLGFTINAFIAMAICTCLHKTQNLHGALGERLPKQYAANHGKCHTRHSMLLWNYGVGNTFSNYDRARRSLLSVTSIYALWNIRLGA